MKFRNPFERKNSFYLNRNRNFLFSLFSAFFVFLICACSQSSIDDSSLTFSISNDDLKQAIYKSNYAKSIIPRESTDPGDIDAPVFIPEFELVCSVIDSKTHEVIQTQSRYVLEKTLAPGSQETFVFDNIRFGRELKVVASVFYSNKGATQGLASLTSRIFYGESNSILFGSSNNNLFLSVKEFSDYAPVVAPFTFKIEVIASSTGDADESTWEKIDFESPISNTYNIMWNYADEPNGKIKCSIDQSYLAISSLQSIEWYVNGKLRSNSPSIILTKDDISERGNIPGVCHLYYNDGSSVVVMSDDFLMSFYY